MGFKKTSYKCLAPNHQRCCVCREEVKEACAISRVNPAESVCSATTLPSRSARTNKSLPASRHNGADPSSIVASSWVVISERKIGRSATRSAAWLRVISFSRWKLWKVLTEFRRSEKISRVICDWTLCRTSNRLREVRPAVIRTIERRNLVRNRALTIFIPAALAYKLIAYTVHGPEMHWIGGVLLQLLD